MQVISDNRIDGGKPFDWGRTSQDYAKYRDIYPQIMYDAVIERGLCKKGQRVLDLGTGTGVLPRNLYRYGADWVGTDISEAQIAQAKLLAALGGMDIQFLTCPAEALSFPAHSFDVITACQCFWYFDHQVIAPMLARMLRPNGRLLLLYMAWLPFEDAIAGESERLILQYNPTWSGAGEQQKPITIPEPVLQYFDLAYHTEFPVSVPFTRESWHGRMRACRGIGASLSDSELRSWDCAHRSLLDRIAPLQFEIKHYIALAELQLK